MLKMRLGAILALTSLTLLAGCHSGQVRQASEQPTQQVAYDPALGQETLIHDGLVYQTIGEPMEGDVSDLVAVGTAEGYVLYQLPGGGAGQGGQNLLFIQTKDGRFQALQPIGNIPNQQQQQRQQNMPDDSMQQHDMPE